MSSGGFPKRFAAYAVCLLAGLWGVPCFAMPPLGYTGPAPVLETTSAPDSTTPVAAEDLPSQGPPPVGYVGPAPASTLASPAVPTSSPISPPATPSPPPAVSSVASLASPPIGYTGPILSAETGTGQTTVMPENKTAPTKPSKLPTAEHPNETLVSALNMHSDSATGIVTATGNVEIVHGGYTLHADKVTYNQKTGVMTADGHIALLTPDGDVQFAKHEEITGDMKQAFATQVGILFPDNSRMAAATATRYDSRYTVAQHGMYTACNICRKDPNNPPLWQIRAASITHDNVAHELYYHDATLDFAGIPVAYTPYLSGPDPTVKRRQGLLPSSPGYSPNIGAFVRVPYYFDIAPDKDLTVAPTFSATDKLQLATQYRERFDKGGLLFNGSFTHADLIDDNGVDEGQKWRGDMMGKFRYDVDNVWRAGTDLQYVSDKSYMQRYNLSSLDQATTRAYLEGFKGRDYAALNSYYFEDLRPGVNAAEPIVLPSMTLSALGDPGQTWGGRWSFDANTLITTRDNSGQTLANQGPDTRRLSLDAGWQRQFISGTGLETTVSGLVRTDSYWANNVIGSDGATVYNQALFTRPFAQANAVMRYPMARAGDGYQQLLEPIVAVTAAPDVRIISKQPIEDSLNVEFDETNLFSPNRFTGSDLIEGGSRVTYGLRSAVTTDSGAHIDVFGGQSYDFSGNSQFSSQSGLATHASDYVGRIDFAPVKWFNANYGFRYSEKNFAAQRQDVLVSGGVPAFRPSVNYIQAYQADPTTNLTDLVRQITFGFSSKLTKYWTLMVSHTQAFDPQPGPRTSSLGISYIDECFAYGIELSHDNTSRVDINSGTSVTFHFYMKNLGGLNTDSVGGITFPKEFRQTAE
ncbi:MAG: LPS assembly protein LptD [Alphaproteobacteria bacterium]|nr:LPS assembly protein LptD [Alphaproteobacteria bacterium]